MVLLASLVLGVIVFIALVGIGLSFLLSSQQRAQSVTDSAALQAAEILNKSDSAGQMNNLISRCRELVYVSRETYLEAGENYRHLEPLAKQLLDEARMSSYTVENERSRLCD